ncbi:MAG TPA: hypothetical protein VFD35_02760 [Pricia sp.]|nr:hypothetical protein [Pricia sp.]
MKASVTLKNVNSTLCKSIIVRNLSRILDIRIIDIDIENGMLHFLCNGQKAFEQVKRELGRIGYPIENYPESLIQNGTSDRIRRVRNSLPSVSGPRTTC